VTAPPRPWLAPLLLAAAGLGLHLACGARYGLFRDELYFVACGQRLAWGYVDQPPLIALVARLAWWLSGEGGSLLLFRLPAMLAHAGTVLLAAGLARQLGGGPLAMATAAAATLASAVQLAQGQLLTMNVLEILLWSGVALASLQAAAGRPTRWIGAGALLGLALLAKYSGAFLAAGLLVGLLLTPARRALAERRLWAGVALAALLAAPALHWQWSHGFPFLELLENGRHGKNAVLSTGQLAVGLTLEQGLLGLPLGLLGLGALVVAPSLAPARFLGVAWAGVAGLLLALGGKPYYFAPLFPLLFAAGALVLERSIPAPTPWRWAPAALLLLLGLPAAPMAIPLLPPERLLAWQERLGVSSPKLEVADTAPISQHFADQLGWEERVEAVAAAWRTLPAEERRRAAIFTTNYGRAAAIELLGGPLGLPRPLCGHNQYFLWSLPTGQPEVVLAVGGRAEDHARTFAEVELVGRTPAVPLGMPYESEIPLYVLRRPLRPLTEAFAEARSYR